MFDVKKTERFHDELKNMNDVDKMRFVINWRIPHSLFKVASNMFPKRDLQGIEWYSIYKSRDLGNWSHGGKVIVQ